MHDADLQGGSSASLAWDSPAAYIAGDRRRALGSGTELPGISDGAGLFADVSGFVAVSELLVAEYGTQRGAEELTGLLNRAIRSVIKDINRFGGSTIYFSGDAVTCWFAGDDGSRAAMAALAAVESMRESGRFTTATGRAISLGLKCSVAVGPARRFVVGDPAIQLIDVLAGNVLTQLAAAEQMAVAGEVVLAASAVASLGERAVIGEQRPMPDSSVRTPGAAVAVLADLRAEVGPAVWEPEPDLPESVVRPWLLPVVYERLRAGLGEFVAELRSALPIFIRFGGLDLAGVEEDAARLDTFVRVTQATLSAHGGNVLQLTLGDKGAYLYAVFGSPQAHGDDPVRAVAALEALGDMVQDLGVTDVQIGLTYGRVRSGTYGTVTRRTFTCLGPPVNLAARLMVAAAPGEVHATVEVVRATEHQFAWQSLGTRQVKGRDEPVEVFVLRGSRSDRITTPVQDGASDTPFVGRRRELARLRSTIDAVAGGHGGVAVVLGEAGRGKSRLVGEALASVPADDVRVVIGEASMGGGHGSYQIWAPVLRELLRVSATQSGPPDGSPADACRGVVGELLPSDVDRTPLLGQVLGVEIPDTDLTRGMDAKLRKTSREDLVGRLVGACATERPLVIVLEDADRADSLSRDLIGVVARASLTRPMALILTMRPGGQVLEQLNLKALPGSVEIHLDALDPADADELLVDRLRRALDAEITLGSPLVSRLRASAEGNPFFIEQLASYAGGLRIDPDDAVAAASLELPGSVHSLVLERLDTMDAGPRALVKVASVVGRQFHPLLIRTAYPQVAETENMDTHLQTAAQASLVDRDDHPELPWRFRHSIVQEVAYQSVPFALRAVMHGHLAEHLEGRHPEPSGAELDLITHHWWHSTNEPKKVEFLGRAADAAQERYANDAAVLYYERLADLTTGVQRARALRGVGQVLELAGRWDEARERYQAALALTGDDAALRAWCETQLADVARRQGHFDEASEHLDRARLDFAMIGDGAGQAQVSHLRGTLAAQQGRNAEARDHYLTSLTLRPEGSDDRARANTLSNLGVVAEYEGDLVGARTFHEQALRLREQLGDLWAIGVSKTGLGMISLLEHRPEQACADFEEAMRLNLAVGDAWMVAITHNNLGNAVRDLGDHAGAMVHYAAAADRYLESDDLWSLAFLLEDAAVCRAADGEAIAAATLLGAADRCREQLGSPRPDSLETELATRLARARETVSGEDWTAAQTAGRQMPTADAVARLRT